MRLYETDVTDNDENNDNDEDDDSATRTETETRILYISMTTRNMPLLPLLREYARLLLNLEPVVNR